MSNWFACLQVTGEASGGHGSGGTDEGNSKENCGTGGV